MLTVNKGTVQTLCDDEDSQDIDKCTGCFTMSMSVLAPVGSIQPPQPSATNLARHKITLAAVKAYGGAEGVTPVRIGSKKVQARFFR